MQNLVSYFERFGNTFLVASLVPSLAFVSILLFVFDPIFPAAIRDRLYGSENSLIQAGLGILIVTIILGFTLTSLNTFVFKVFEGYVVIQRFPFLKRRQIHRAKVLKTKIKSAAKLIDRLSAFDTPSIQKRVKKLKSFHYGLKVTYDESYPPSDDDILPTTFGNIFKAAEAYPRTRYGIDGVPIWPRLIHVIPDRYMSFIDKDANQLSFLMNCAILSFFTCILSLIASGYQLFVSHYVKFADTLLYFNKLNLTPEIYRQRSLLYGIGSIVAILLAILFVRASLLVVKDYGNLIRSAYDLFRKDLLIQLNFGLPSSTEYEYDHWGAISEFITLGNINNDLLLDYYYWDEAKKVD